VTPVPVSDVTIEDLARTSAFRLLKHWASQADPTELCDELYEQADLVGRADICKYLEYDADGYADDIRGALKTLISEIEGQVKTVTHPNPPASAS
jgi:hypothetical protein